MASQAMEACASEHAGRYADCSESALLSIQPALAEVDSRLLVTSGPGTYTIAVVSRRDPSVSFTLARAADGTTRRTCSTGTADRGGCQVPSTGTW